MALTVTHVPYGHISYVLPKLLHNLQKSELWTKGRASVDDIVRFLYTQHMQLWAVHDPETEQVWGYYITEIKQYPKIKILVVQYSAGDFGMLEEANDVGFATVEQFAKAEGCQGIEFFGRPGWRNAGRKHGYTTQTVVYEKFFQ
jgi:hypothetical protein